MSASSTPLFVCTFILFCYVLTVPGLPVNSDKYDDSQQKTDSLDSSGSRNMAVRSFGAARRNLRSMYGLEPRMVQISRSKIPIELDLLVDNENDGERAKRFDDYGHMRFGKRGGEDQFDDYGHMRFGR